MHTPAAGTQLERIVQHTLFILIIHNSLDIHFSFKHTFFASFQYFVCSEKKTFVFLLSCFEIAYKTREIIIINKHSIV